MVKQRNVGADVIRVLAMLMVCVLHVNNLSGGMESFPNCLYEMVCIQAVNLFAMLTGYLCIEAGWKIRRYMNLWFQVAFYAVGGLLLGCVLKRAGMFEAYHPPILKVLLPVPLAGGYWYFTAYTAVFLLIPFLNRLIKNLSQREAGTLFLIVALCLPLMSSLPGYGHIYHTGYNMVWLTALYVMGAYLRLYPLPWSRTMACITLIGSLSIQTVLFGLGSKCIVSMLMVYAFPLVVLSSVCMFHLCIGLPIKSPGIVGVVTYLTPLAFGVYLAQCHPFSWHALQKILGLLHYHVGDVWWYVPVFALALFAGCLFVDWCRARLFSMLRVSAWADRLAAACPAWLKEMEKM